MKLTTLEFVQRALSAIDAENVQTIDDSTEAEQVKLILDAEYERLINRFPWTCKETMGTLHLTPEPMKMALPTNTQQVKWIKYNGKDIEYLPLKDFHDMILNRDIELEYVDDVGYYMDRDPSFYTIYEDLIVFDAYEISLVETLSRVYYLKSPEKLIDDLSIPLIPDILHTALLDAVLGRTMRELKGDETGAKIHYNNYIRTIIQAQRWADNYFPEVSTNTEVTNYDRKRT